MSGPRRSDPPEFPGRRPRPRPRPGPQPPPRGPAPREQDTTPIPMPMPRRPGGGRSRPPVDPWWQRIPRSPPAGRPPQPMHPPAPPAAPQRQRTARRYSKRWLLIAPGLAVLGVLAVILAVGLGRPGGATELDVNQAEIGVQQVLTDPINGYGRDNVTDVRCNNGRNPTVKSGSSFTCAVNVDGATRQVTVVFSDGAGTYEVDRPR